MTLIAHNISNLKQIKEILVKVTDQSYTEPRSIISGVTVGQHIRHILEFYICIEHSLETGYVCYDERKRDTEIEQNRKYAIQVIDNLCTFIHSVKKDHQLILKANFSEIAEETTEINSTFFRELAYSLDHTVHHLAIVKIAFTDSGQEIDENIGVAPSTIRYREETCAQ